MLTVNVSKFPLVAECVGRRGVGVIDTDCPDAYNHLLCAVPVVATAPMETR